MKTVVIAGDSWGCGEWQRASEPPGTQLQLITHPGLGGYLIEDGYNVVNLSEFSEGNHQLLKPLKYFMEVNQHLNIEHVFFIQTDIFRSVRDKQLDFNTFITKHSNLSHSIKMMYHDFYSKLNHNAMLGNYSVNLIGGLTDLISELDVFNNLNFLIPSWCRLVDSTVPNLSLTDPMSIEYLNNNYGNQAEILSLIEQSLARSDFWKKHPNIFWPDGCHPNRLGHKVLYDAIKTKLNL